MSSKPGPQVQDRRCSHLDRLRGRKPAPLHDSRYVELDQDDDYDGSSGPLYAVELTPGQHGDAQVAEADLSPLPPPSLRLVDDDEDDEG